MLNCSAVDVFCGAASLYMDSFLSKPENATEKARVLATSLADLAHAPPSTAFVDLTVTFVPLQADDPKTALRTPTVRVFF
jgi:hypothetical protein